MRRHPSTLLLLVSVCLSLCLTLPAVAQSYGDLPLSFEPNLGQSSAQVQFLSHGKGYGFFLSGDSATLRLGSNATRNIQLTLANGKPPSQVSGEKLLPGTVNYFEGSDPSRWLHNVPSYARVRMTSVYPGIDLVYYGNHRQLEYDVVVHPGASAAQFALVETGADALQLDDDGGLTMQAGAATLHWHAPVAYQQVNGRNKPIAAKYQVAGSTIRFAVGDYDRTRDLVIDPVLVYSTYLGGSGGDVGDVGNAIAVDDSGNAYVAGLAASTDFPTAGNAMQPASQGHDDAYVAKLNPQGTGFVYSTYLGGGGQDVAYALAVNSAGEAFVAGQTGSGLHGTAPFPTTAGAYQRSHNPAILNYSVFVAKLTADGSDLVYSTLVSGANDAFATGIAIDGSDNAYVITNTASGFPVTTGAMQRTAGTDKCPFQQFADGQSQVVSKVSADGSSLVYSTYVGHGCDYGAAIAVNSAGEAYITGHTQDSAYPVTAGAAQVAFGGVIDGFVTRLNATGSGLIYSTFLGGSLIDISNGIALDSAGYAYVAGGTDGGNFPTTPGAFQPIGSNDGTRKGFITKIAPLGRGLVYSTFIKGAGNVTFNAIDVTRGQYATVTGYTDGKQYPATSTAVQNTCYASSSGCLTQAVVTRLNAAGSALLYSSYFGASDATNTYFPGNIGNAIAVDNAGDFYVTGRTSNGLRTTSGAVEPSYRADGSSSNAFVAKFTLNNSGAGTRVQISSPTNGATTPARVRVTATASGGTVQWMQVFVDGTRKAQVAGSSVTTALTLPAGQRKITVRAVDKDGSEANSSVSVTVK